MKGIQITIISCLLVLAQNVCAQDYYSGTSTLYGEDLRESLHQLIDNHTELSYSQCKTVLKESDEDSSNSNNIILVYKQNSIDKDNFAYSSSLVDYWNREHVWAKSLGSFGPGGTYENGPAHTDVHNLKPCDASVNSDRGNKSFDNGGAQHNDALNCYYTSNSWEAPDDVKGDIARILFYMDVRYEGGYNEPDLTLVELLDTYPNPEIGKLETLLEWHLADPVDEFEFNRNEVIFSWQGNRNPFIDHPEYVARIWGADLGSSLISIPNGWFMLGLNRIPEVNTMEALFEPIVNHLVIAKDVNGNVFLPEWSFDNIGSLALGEGLLIKVDTAQIMTIQGAQINLPENPMQIPVGWSMKSFMKNTPIDVLDFIDANEDIVIIKDYFGNACIPAMNFNGIGDFQPGQAYLIKSISEISIPWE